MVPLVMGILNVTPDSFSDGGAYLDSADAVARAVEMIADGAAIIDIGGESTRPGAEPVPLQVEIDRVVPVVEAVAAFGARVSVDTRHAEVARKAVAAGASMINDVSASLWPIAAELGVGWIAMHMSGEPATMQASPTYVDVVREVRESLVGRARAARSAGVDEVWIDPGFGFGKSVDHNVALIAAVDEFVATGFDVVVGVSRKRTLGLLTARADGIDEDTDPLDRLEAGLAMATWAMASGAAIVRVHDVRAHVRAALVVSGEIGAGEIERVG